MDALSPHSVFLRGLRPLKYAGLDYDTTKRI